uniref:Murine leukemia virus integrase C-terminal domain-containing protein n=1 Tax=Ficedula albicollis TaxID=59894 RepID=A0A803V3R9_FICAL
EEGEQPHLPPLACPGDWVLVKSLSHTCLFPRYEGTYQVLLTTHTAVRTKERGWTHISQVKGPIPPPTGRSDSTIPQQGTPEWTITKGPTDLKFTFKRREKDC